MEKLPIEIFRYTDSRLFLRDALNELKGLDAKYSHRYVVMKLGMKSSGWLADILAGRKNLSIETLRNVADFFKMTAREKAYFEALVFYTQAESHEEKFRYYEHLLTFREVSADIIGKDRFEYFSNWYNMAMREWMLVEPYEGRDAEYGAKMLPHISAEEVSSSIALMDSLGMLEKHASGRFVPASIHLKKQSDFDRVYYFAHIKACFEHALWAMKNVPKEGQRELSTMTSAMSEESFQEICDDISALRRKIAAVSEKECRERRITGQTSPMRVFQFLFSGHPLTQKESSL